LLKSPFVAHPKTGRVCVPIDASKADEFNPFTVPTLRDLVNQIDAAHTSSSSGAAADSSSQSDLEKTALHPYIQFFESSFLKPLYSSIRRKLRDETEKQAALAGDF
jgi:DNA primase small subunit